MLGVIGLVDWAVVNWNRVRADINIYMCVWGVGVELYAQLNLQSRMYMVFGGVIESAV